MIVKDEKKVIERCLTSVKPYIDYWVIVDTGSTDGTQEIVTKTMEGIPGALYERPWVNFGHNRNEAMKLARGKGDYLLFIDADEEMKCPEEFTIPFLSYECYLGKFVDPSSGLDFMRMLLLKNREKYAWEGVVHEMISPVPLPGHILDGPTVFIETAASNRSQDSKKYQKDAALLEKAIEEDPSNSRHYYYLGQTYFNSGDYARSLKNYSIYAAMEPQPDNADTYWALYLIGYLQEKLEFPEEEVVKGYEKAYAYRPIRAEPLVSLAQYYLTRKKYELSYRTISKCADLKKPPNEPGYVDDDTYTFKQKFIHAEAAYKVQKYAEAEPLFRELVEKKLLPDFLRADGERRLSSCVEKRSQTRVAIAAFLDDIPPDFAGWLEYHRKMGCVHFYLYGNMELESSQDVTVTKWDRGETEAFENAVAKTVHSGIWLALLSPDERLPIATLVQSLAKYKKKYPALLFQGVTILQPETVLKVVPGKVEYIKNNQPYPLTLAELSH